MTPEQLQGGYGHHSPDFQEGAARAFGGGGASDARNQIKSAVYVGAGILILWLGLGGLDRLHAAADGGTCQTGPCRRSMAVAYDMLSFLVIGAGICIPATIAAVHGFWKPKRNTATERQ